MCMCVCICCKCSHSCLCDRFCRFFPLYLNGISYIIYGACLSIRVCTCAFSTSMCFNECMCMCACLSVSFCGCVCVQGPQRDQWARTWPCQYSWPLCVFSQSNHGNGAVQTGCLRRGFESHNVTTAISFIMPWLSVTGQQILEHTTQTEVNVGVRCLELLHFHRVEWLICLPMRLLITCKKERVSDIWQYLASFACT